MINDTRLDYFNLFIFYFTSFIITTHKKCDICEYQALTLKWRRPLHTLQKLFTQLLTLMNTRLNNIIHKIRPGIRTPYHDLLRWGWISNINLLFRDVMHVTHGSKLIICHQIILCGCISLNSKFIFDIPLTQLASTK